MKRIIPAFSAVLLCAALSTPAFAAGSLGEISAITDTVLPDGENASITSVVTGTTDSEGALALPLDPKSALQSVTVLSGTQQGELAETQNGATSYYVARFAEKEAEVSLRLAYTREGAYALSVAKTKGTAPGKMKTVKYKMRNSAPVAIGSYKLELAIPQGFELSGIIDYDPEDDYAIYSADGYKFGHHDFGELSPGEEASMSINLQKPSLLFTAGCWAVTVAASAFFLYKNKGMLAQAREAAAKKRAAK